LQEASLAGCPLAPVSGEPEDAACPPPGRHRRTVADGKIGRPTGGSPGGETICPIPQARFVNWRIAPAWQNEVHPITMRTGTSLYLDLVRFAAALTVFLSHYGTSHFTGGRFYQMQPYGPQAVDVFFVLSGFVISHATDRRENGPRRYIISRMARLYSVAGPALLLTLVLDTAGSALHPDMYPAHTAPHYHADDLAGQYLMSALFVNQLWYLDVRPGTDWPYWSLGYEVWYYVIFGVAMFAPRRIRAWALLAAAAVAGPRILALFPLWLLGVACHRLTRATEPSAPLGAICLTVSVVGWIGYEVLAAHHGRLPGLAPDVFHRAELSQDYLVAGFFGLHLIGICHLSEAVGDLLRPVAKPIRWLAGATFSIYLMHYPVMQFLAAVMPWPLTRALAQTVLFALTLAGVFLMAEISERRKDAWRRVFESMSRRLVLPFARPAG
jgi:peptidoglycan/LPS O-acetylase OafA/YrhL